MLVSHCYFYQKDISVSEREELNVSKSGPLYPAKRTSARRAATSPMGHEETLRFGSTPEIKARTDLRGSQTRQQRLQMSSRSRILGIRR